MKQDEIDQFESFDKKIIRRKLLPIWIKIFCWIFMLMGVASIFCLLLGVLGKTADISLFGFQTNEPFSMIGLFITSLMLFKGFCAYSLWFEKDYAIKICKIDALLGVVVCLVSMYVMNFSTENSHFSFRIEIVLLIPYYSKLNKIEYEWNNLHQQ